jgi:signal transduction histidine kinase/DNA-binding response OmpR family regulator
LAVDLGPVRRNLRLQRSRLASYTAALLLAVLLRTLGSLEISWRHVIILYSASLLSVGLSSLFLRSRRSGRTTGPLAWLPVGLDMLFISSCVYFSGGVNSPWYIWYLSNMLAAAFMGGTASALIVAVASSLAYFGVLALLGQLPGHLIDALARMLLLFVPFYFSLSGIAQLKRQRHYISELKEGESRKVAELTRLSQALDERTQALAEANVKIREADRLKSQFLANMSHELRTPLNSIIGFSEILRTRLASKLEGKQLKFLDNIHTSGTHLLGLINDILDLSKVEAGKLELHVEAFSPLAVVEGVINIMTGQARERGIEFHIDAPPNLPQLEADAIRFKQILYNLLSNAVKFSPDKSPVTVTLNFLRARHCPLKVDALELSVRDRGPGIDPKDHQLIWEEFRQLDGTSTREHQGTGLGLALVKSIVELHYGMVGLTSRLGEGATFSVLIPRQFGGDGEVTMPPLPHMMTSQDHRPRVLIVEDDSTAYDKMAIDLGRAGFRCLRARTGEEALSLARALKPSAMTLDLVLPGIDGWEVLRRMKADSQLRDLPVIIVSVVENRDLGLALGADDYFTKPIDGSVLARRVRALLPTPTAHLLIIDDDPELHDMLDATLAPVGYTLEHALDGPEGLKRASERPPDLVILDLMMRGMDGFDVANKLKSEEKTAHVPILVLTNKDLSLDERGRLHGKIGALLQKSNGVATSQQLVHALQDLLRRAEVRHV